ncbi:hypothetical protein Agub_g3030, partial [Astrephomene gubernaculifera]
QDYSLHHYHNHHHAHHHHHHHEEEREQAEGCRGGRCRSGYSSLRALGVSLGHALGPSFGSLCAAGGLLGATAGVRALVNRFTPRPQQFATLQYRAPPGGAHPPPPP